MKLGRNIFETGKLTGLEPHQSFYFAYSLEETKFGQLDSILVATIPIETLTIADDEVPHHVRNFISNYEALEILDHKARLRKALKETQERRAAKTNAPITAIIFNNDGTVLSNTSTVKLLRIRGDQPELFPLNGGKPFDWEQGDRFILVPERLAEHIAPEELAAQCSHKITSAIPNCLYEQLPSKKPCSIMAFCIKKPVPIVFEPAFFLVSISALMVLLYYLLIRPHIF